MSRVSPRSRQTGAVVGRVQPQQGERKEHLSTQEELGSSLANASPLEWGQEVSGKPGWGPGHLDTSAHASDPFIRNQQLTFPVKQTETWMETSRVNHP